MELLWHQSTYCRLKSHFLLQIQWTSVYVVEMVVLRKQFVDTFQTINDTSDPDQLAYFTSTVLIWFVSIHLSIHIGLDVIGSFVLLGYVLVFQMQHIKLQERLFDLYKVENKRMAAIVEELKAELKISDNVADAGEKVGHWGTYYDPIYQPICTSLVPYHYFLLTLHHKLCFLLSASAY